MTKFVVVFVMAMMSVVAIANIAPEVPIELFKPPEFRWRAALEEIVKDPIRLANVAGFFPGIAQIYAIAGCDAACKATLVATYRARYPMLYRELAGNAAFLAAHGVPITTEELVADQFIVEIFHSVPGFKRNTVNAAAEYAPFIGCTSIVACNAAGDILHARNLDFTMPQVFRNMTVRARFERFPGIALFESEQFIIEAGITTGVRAGHTSISYNWRSEFIPLADVMQCITQRDTIAPLSAGLRAILESGLSYESAVHRIENGKLCSPMYITMAAPKNKGTHITKSFGTTGSLFPNTLDCSAAATTPSTTPFFIAQTNYDNGVSPAWDDRLGLATAAMNAMGQTIGSTFQGLFNVLSIPPVPTSRGVLNELTVYSSIINPTTGTIPSEVRNT